MGWVELLLLSLSLAMDCFAISCVVGMLQPVLEKRFVWRFSLAFGIFQGGMPLIGWLFGESLLGPLEKLGPFIAFGILAFIGGKMLIESIKKGDDEKLDHLDITKWKNVILLAVATSIDALAVGFGFAMIHEEHIIRAFLTIGITSFVVSFLAYTFVRKLANPKIGKYAETVGGIVLILIGLKILLW
jgi:putative Mn2+ efflux pump MntP